MTSKTTRSKAGTSHRAKAESQARTGNKTAAGPARQSVAAGPRPKDVRREQVALVYRYGTIGIEAVVAAARYAGPQRAAGAPKAQRIDPRFLETSV
jgi:hypothetical protein